VLRDTAWAAAGCWPRSRPSMWNRPVAWRGDPPRISPNRTAISCGCSRLPIRQLRGDRLRSSATILRDAEARLLADDSLRLHVYQFAVRRRPAAGFPGGCDSRHEGADSIDLWRPGYQYPAAPLAPITRSERRRKPVVDSRERGPRGFAVHCLRRLCSKTSWFQAHP
jgi:hypothetical protein